MIAETTRDDLMWLVGILEGEACFDLHRGKYPRVRVAMVDRDVVGRVATLFGSTIRLTLKKEHQATWHAEVSGPKAVEIMTAVLPHMGARRSAKIAEILGRFHLRKSVSSSTPGPKLTRPPGLLHSVKSA